MSNQSKSPTHIAYHVRDGKEKGKSFWTRVGCAWQHQDGKGFNILLDTLPITGSITLRAAAETRDESEGKAAA
jgi:hypothetical protein